ncbi:MAG: biopolymer transporter ExbD [Elusimicrobia bacterium]|nr:biopolymer transporter ExbD [Elusimicrobiota bacterium]
MAGIQGDPQDAITGINVTPLVDVMLVLLIIFMATAPMLQRRALHVQIPKAQRSERVATETTRVEFAANGELQLDGKTLTRADLIHELGVIVSRQPAAHVAVAADKKIPYGEIVALLDEIRGAGVQRVGLEVQRR